MSNNMTTHQYEDAFRSLVAFRDDADRLAFEADLIQLRIMDRVRIAMQRQHLTKAMLAEAMGIRVESLTQLFTADTRVTLELVAQFERILGTICEENP